jgi:hypothetical protein
MSDFKLDRMYDTIVLAATSVLLLDRNARDAMFECVAAHLKRDGAFLVTAPTAIPSVTSDYEETWGRNDEGRTVRFHEHVDIECGRRSVALVEVGDDDQIHDGFFSSVWALDAHAIAEEAREAGFCEQSRVLISSRAVRRSTSLLVLGR